MRWRRDHGTTVVQLGIAVLLVLLASAGALRVDLAPAPIAAAAAVRPGPSPLNFGTAVGSQPISPQFWGLNIEPTHPFNSTDARLVNATPLTYLRFPAGNYAEEMNWTSSVLTSSTTGATQTAVNTMADFVSACALIQCHAMLQLPMEINSTSTIRYFVAYVEQTLSFRPAVWELGNNPPGWKHFNAPWPMWGNSSTGNTTPMAFASEVQRAIAAIRGLDPTTPIVALGGGMVGPHYDQSWIGPLLQVDGPELAGVSLHDYPGWTGTANSTLADFFAALNSTWALSKVIASDRAFIRTACPNCTTQLIVTEANANYGGGTFDGWLASFNDTLFLAAEVTQALRVQAPSVYWFDFQSNYPGTFYPPGRSPGPNYYLFSQILSRLGNATLDIATPGPSTFFTAATTGAEGESYLAVNVDLTSPVLLNLTRAGFAPGGNVTERYWPTGAARPSVLSVPSDATVQLPSLSLALFSNLTFGGSHGNGSSPTYRVLFTENGLPAGTSWTVTLGDLPRSSSQGPIVFDEPNGTYNFSVGSVTGYSQSPTTGQVSVAGGEVDRAIAFSKLALPLPLAVSLSASPASLPLGNSTTIAAAVSGGTPPFSYAYTSLPVGCTSIDNATLRCTPTAIGNSTVRVHVNDAGHAEANGTVEVTVLASNVSPPPSQAPTSPPAPTAPVPWYMQGNPPYTLLVALGIAGAAAVWGAIAIARRR